MRWAVRLEVEDDVAEGSRIGNLPHNVFGLRNEQKSASRG